MTVLLATGHGVFTATRDRKGWNATQSALRGQVTTSIVSRESVILAGTTDGVYRSDDGSSTWKRASQGLDILHVRWIAYHPEISDLEFAGTEPAGIFVSHDGAGSWRSCPEVADLRDRHAWWLPYSPEAGCVRGFAFHGSRAYAAVEVGGVLRSDDGGNTWRLAGGSTGEPVFDVPPEPFVFADVHSVMSHPRGPAVVFAATAEGLYRSEDAGDTWEVTHAGSYCRAGWVDANDHMHIVLGPADSVAKKNGRIEETRDGGRTWSVASDGLDLPWPDRMVERFVEVDDDLLAVTSDGRLYSSRHDSLSWSRVLPDVPDIRDLCPYRADA